MRELKPVEIGAMPDLVRLAEEVQSEGARRILRRNGEDVAVLLPAKRAARRRRATSPSDPLWDIVGIAHSGGPSDVAENKHKDLADAHTLKQP